MHGPFGLTCGPEPTIDAKPMIATRKPVASQAPLPTTQTRSEVRRTGFVSELRITSATISAMNGAKRVSRTAATFCQPS